MRCFSRNLDFAQLISELDTQRRAGLQVLGAMGIDVVAHIPAQDIAAVLSLFGDAATTAGSVGGGRPQKLRGGVGLIKLNFSKASLLTRAASRQGKIEALTHAA